MDVWHSILRFLDLEMETPTPYGWFHLLWLGITAAAAVGLCLWHKTAGPDRVRRVVLWVTVWCAFWKCISRSISASARITISNLITSGMLSRGSFALRPCMWGFWQG